MGYLVDSNVLIDYAANRFTPAQLAKLDLIFDEVLNCSIITRIETLGFQLKDNQEEKLMVQFFNIANVIPLSDPVAEQTIGLRKSIKIKIPDAIIAATALIYNHTVLTRNTSDFLKFPV